MAAQKRISKKTGRSTEVMCIVADPILWKTFKYLGDLENMHAGDLLNTVVASYIATRALQIGLRVPAETQEAIAAWSTV